MNIVNDRGQVPFPRELQERATAAGRDPAGLPERWMCVVVRRETITPAVGKIVHVRRVCLAFTYSWVPNSND